ncbi:SSU ribosomal protein S4P [Arboricoccus pini]|uniref:Small ribosomal subunit protein uS4 n=1 Tax=Arboricoccus pini TaxID=1963835 RepID=A0A212RDR4_9PROT|nr:30S ribosomal protein S4 [Arboricoccus pini]SNB70411.1 SSU ribosomal protein S4P [Arboricoccus pini]
MTKRIEAKGKISRRLGVNLWGRAKDPLARKNYAPGMHGQKRKKLSGYALQLIAKQKLKSYYANMTERQFRRTYEEAVRLKGDTGENLIGLLERRLDMVIYRMNFAPTIFAARQFVNHGHVSVNGRRVNISSYRVREGDEIEVRERSRNHQGLLETTAHPERDVPEYMTVDTSVFKGQFVRVPKMADVPYPVQMEPNLVIEYYSR